MPVNAAIVSLMREKLRMPSAGSGTSGGAGGGDEGATASAVPKRVPNASNSRWNRSVSGPCATGITAPSRDSSVPEASTVVSMRRNACAATGTVSLTAMRMFFTRTPVEPPTNVGRANR